MKIAILDKKRKQLYKVINLSSALLVCLLFTALILQITGYDKAMVISLNLMLISLFPFIIAVISTIILAFHKHKFIDYNEHNKNLLILNLKEYDFKMGDLGFMGYSSNYIVDPNSEINYEITSTVAKNIIETSKPENLSIKFDRKGSKMLEESPKSLYSNILWPLEIFQ